MYNTGVCVTHPASHVAVAYTALTMLRSKTARNEQVCTHQKWYRKWIFQNIFGNVLHMSGILLFFSAAWDGATLDRQIPNSTFWSSSWHFNEG